MEFAMGVLHWSETEFWDSTPLGLTSAYVGYCRREGLGRWQNDQAGFNFETAEIAQRDFEKMKARLGGSRKPKMTKEAKRDYKAKLKHGGGVIRG